MTSLIQRTDQLPFVNTRNTNRVDFKAKNPNISRIGSATIDRISEIQPRKTGAGNGERAHRDRRVGIAHMQAGDR